MIPQPEVGNEEGAGGTCGDIPDRRNCLDVENMKGQSLWKIPNTLVQFRTEFSLNLSGYDMFSQFLIKENILRNRVELGHVLLQILTGG